MKYTFSVNIEARDAEEAANILRIKVDYNSIWEVFQISTDGETQ